MYINSILNNSESIVYSAKVSSKAFKIFLVEAVIILCLAFWAHTIVGLVFLVGFLPIAIAQLIAIYSVEFAVTNSRVIKKIGLFSRDTKEVPLKKVESVEIMQTWLGRVFGFGGVRITGSGVSSIIIVPIDSPNEFRAKVAELI